MEVRLRPAARRDVEEAVDWLSGQAGAHVSSSFIDAVEAGLAHIRRHPEGGSSRPAFLLGIEGLRAAVVSGHPYLILYIVRAHFIDVVRVLHMRRDPDAELAGG